MFYIDMLSPLFSVSLCAFMSGMYSGFLHYPLKNYIRQMYEKAGINSFLVISSFPGDLKFLWIHYLENIEIPFIKCGVKKKLIIFMDFIMALITFGFYYLEISDIFYFILYLSIFNFFMSLRDSISVGYKMEFFSKETLGEVSGVISASYNLGLWVGGGLLFLFASNWYFHALSWSSIIFYCAVFFLFNSIANFFIANSKEYEKHELTSNVHYFQYLIILCSLLILFYFGYHVLHLSMKIVVSMLLVLSMIFFIFTVRNDQKVLIIYHDLLLFDKKQLLFILGFLLSYKIAARVIMNNLMFLFFEAKYSNNDMFVFKTIATFITLFNAWALPFCWRLFSKRAFKLFGLFLYIIPITMFIFVFHNSLNYLIFYICIIERVARTFLEEVYFLSKTEICGKKYAMTQLTALSCIEKIFGNFVAMGSGYIVEFLSWEALFVLCLVSMLPSFFFSLKFNSQKNLNI